MKAISKFILPAVLLIGSAVMAQEKKSKVCIKLNENKDGVVRNIDTCFESTDPAEVEAFLKRIGVDNEMIVTSGSNSKTKRVIIKNEENNSGQKNQYTYSFSGDEGDENVMVIVDDKGNVISNAGDAKVIVRTFDGDDKELEKEIEELMKEAEKGGTVNVSENGKTKKKEVRIVISRKIEINNISAEDKKTMPADLQQLKGNAFEGLNLYPNPAKDHVTIHYKGNTSEPLTIRLYDAQGKTIMTEKEINTDKEMSKKLDLTSLKQGIYFLHLEQGKRSEVKKLVVSQ